MMPELTGMELHAQLLDLAPDQADRMVFVTGGAYTEMAQRFLARLRTPWFENRVTWASSGPRWQRSSGEVSTTFCRR